MRRLLSTLCRVIVLATCACGNSLAAFSPPDNIVVVSDDTYPPYLFRGEGGKLQGILVDKWALWSKKTGIHVNVAGMPWFGAQEVTREGSADVIEAITFTGARAELYEFSPPYAKVDARIFFHRSISGINNDPTSMRGFAIGAKHGSACGNWLTERGIDTIFGYPTSEELIKAAGAGEVRLFCMDSPVAEYYLLKLNLTDSFRQTNPLYVAQFHWAVVKGRTELRDFIQRGFDGVDASELRAVEERWTGSPVRPPFDSRYLYLAAAAASMIAGTILLFAWRRSLAAQTLPDNAEQHALTRIFYFIAVAVAIATGVAIVNNLLFGRNGVPVALPSAALVVIALILAARRGYVRLARAALPPVVAAASAYFVLSRDGVHDAAVFALAGSLVIGGVLLTRRAMVLLTIAALAVFLGAGSAEIVGSLHTRLSEFTDAQYLVGTSVAFVVLALTSVVVAESLFMGLRHAEEKSSALSASEDRLARMVAASPEAITIASLDDGTFAEVNPASERLSGYTRGEMIGRSSLALGFWPDAGERDRFVADLLRDEIIYGREIQLRRKDGQLRNALASAALIDLLGRKFILFQGIDITERKNAEKAVQQHQELLRELSAHHDSVREGERANIAREIHDEMGQALTALKMDLSVLGLESGKDSPKIREQIRELKGRVDAMIQIVRNVATALRPAALDLGILSGIEWLVDEFQKRSGIPCKVKVEDGEFELAGDRAIVVFRILQESLTNISRHANARNVEVSLRHDGTHVRLDVKDDGQGFDAEAAARKKTFGLLGIRERAIMLHGTLNICSVPGEGTQISLSIPVQET
jgi:PAS domain S-box-containing protein